EQEMALAEYLRQLHWYQAREIRARQIVEKVVFCYDITVPVRVGANKSAMHLKHYRAWLERKRLILIRQLDQRYFAIAFPMPELAPLLTFRLVRNNIVGHPCLLISAFKHIIKICGHDQLIALRVTLRLQYCWNACQEPVQRGWLPFAFKDRMQN